MIYSNLFLYPRFHHPYPACHFRAQTNEKYSAEEENKVGNKQTEVPTYRIQNVNLSESDGGIELSMDLPGIKAKDVSAVLDKKKGLLKINALKKQGDNIIKKYQREFSLDKKSINVTELSATLLDGVLTIALPGNPAPEIFNITPKAMDPPGLEEEDKEDSTFNFMLELPGVKLGDLIIRAQGDKILIHAARKTGSYSSVFKRSYIIPDAYDMKQTSAYLMDGILTIMAPKQTTAKTATQEISIPINNTASEDATPDINSTDTPVIVQQEEIAVENDDDGILVETAAEGDDKIKAE